MPARDIRTVTPEQAEAADFLVCVLVDEATPLPPIIDQSPWAIYQRMVRARSAIEPCGGCGRKILVDSISPKKPPKVCMECVGNIIENEGKPKQ